MCRKKEYEVALSKADKDRVYNMPEAGKVYNYLEDIVEEIKGDGFVCRGTMGELYLVPLSKADVYDVDVASVGSDWVTVCTRPQARVYFCRKIEGTSDIHTPAGVMHANRDGVAHGEGDRVLCSAIETAEGYVPDEADCWVVNGLVFERTYTIL